MSHSIVGRILFLINKITVNYCENIRGTERHVDFLYFG